VAVELAQQMAGFFFEIFLGFFFANLSEQWSPRSRWQAQLLLLIFFGAGHFRVFRWQVWFFKER
jgi:hypothetical protein